MTTTIIKDTNSIAENATGDHGVDLNAGDFAFVLNGGSIIESGLNAIGIEVSGDNATVKVDGLVYATSEAIDSSAQGLNITVNGEVMSDLYAMYLSGDDNHVTIGTSGQIEGSLIVTGNGSDVHNSGLISAQGGRTAVYLGASGLWNTGTIVADTEAVHFQGNATGSVTNSGTIIGSLTEEFPISPTATMNIYNSGQWMGDLNLTETGDLVQNTGTITGALNLRAGDDTYNGSNGHIYGIVDGGDGNDMLMGGSEDNTFQGGAGRDTIDGGAGNNTAQYFSSAARVVVDLSTGIAKGGDASGDHLTHIQNITGTAYDDKLTGDAQDNVLNGLIGNDKLTGNDGNDTLIMLGGNGKTVMDGGNGNDVLELTDLEAHTYGNAFGAGSKITGGAGFDRVELKGDYTVAFNATTMQGVEYLQMDSGFNYKLTTHDATVAAGQTMEIDASQLDATTKLTFSGAAENDGAFIIDGGAGKDTLTGGKGGDTFIGGAGADKITGGLGHDIFVFETGSDSTGKNFDVITDFDANNDSFQLPNSVAAIDAPVSNAFLSASTLPANLTTAANGHLGANDAMLITASSGDLIGHTFLIVDANGVAGYQNNDFVVDVTGMTGTLTTGDFITG